jgi:hypothetical protein
MTDQQQRAPKDADDLIFGGGGNTSATFGERDAGPGGFVEGIVVDKRVAADLNFASGKPELWDDGSPKQHPVITLQTQQRADADDDGIRDLHVKISKQPGGMSRVIAEATKAAYPNDPKPVVEIGAWLRVDYVAQVPTKTGTARAYTAQYRTPADVALTPELTKAQPVQNVATPAPAQPAPVATPAAAAAPAAGMPTPEQIARLAALNPAYATLPLAALEGMRPVVPGIGEALDGPPPAAAAAAAGALTGPQMAALAVLDGGATLVGLPLPALQAIGAARPDVAAALAAA